MAQWYLPAAAALLLTCYLCGRRGRTAAAVVLLAAAELAATIAVAARHDPASWLIHQAIIVVALSATTAGAYRRLRQDLTLRGWSHAREARLRERTRVASEIHDTLGHDLTLLSLRAAAIQVKAADPEIREQAAALRAGAAQAIATVRGLVDLLGADHTAGVVQRARDAGMTIEVTGDPPETAFTARLITEALSNAARHAPGEPVRIVFAPGGHVEISNPARRVELSNPARRVDASNAAGQVDSTPGPPDGPHRPRATNPKSRTGTGLATLAARLENAGGALTTDTASDVFRITARVPEGIDDDPAQLATDFAARRRRLRTTLAAGVLAPLVSLGVLSAAFYTWAAHDATVEPTIYRQLHVGMDEQNARAILPPRQARIRSGDPTCRHYTDGNFPLAYGNYEICFRDGRISTLRDSTGGPA